MSKFIPTKVFRYELFEAVSLPLDEVTYHVWDNSNMAGEPKQVTVKMVLPKDIPPYRRSEQVREHLPTVEQKFGKPIYGLNHVEYNKVQSNILMVMVGVPCGGKSTFIKDEISEYPDHDVQVISLDNIRDELCEAYNCTYKELFSNKEALKQLTDTYTNQLEEAAKESKTKTNKIYIVDNTNLTKTRRKEILDKFQDSNCLKVAVTFDCVGEIAKYYINKQVYKTAEEEAKHIFDLCNKRDDLSKKQGSQPREIPYQVILSMVKSIEEIDITEGFDYVSR